MKISSNYKSKLNELKAIDFNSNYVSKKFIIDELTLDLGYQGLTSKHESTLLAVAKECELSNQMRSMHSGSVANPSEGRQVGHMWLRDRNLSQEVAFQHDQMHSLRESLLKKNIKNAIVIGIGGSELGPKLVLDSLKGKAMEVNIEFCSNIDLHTIELLKSSYSPKDTALIVISKTFTTFETMLLLQEFATWQSNKTHIVAITANKSEACKYVEQEHILEFWDWVGGRYSIWSTVFFPVYLAFGKQAYTDFLQGANIIDEHALSSDDEFNLPLNLSLHELWNINFRGIESHLIMPYIDRLNLLPAYLQQLEMESNGKRFDLDGKVVNYATAPIIWGGVGTNGQHSYMQLLHQGTVKNMIDFVLLEPNTSSTISKALFASCMGQIDALFYGEGDKFAGKTPISLITLSKLSIKVLGMLLALYEHKVFYLGKLWGINSFDQPGVELGKSKIKHIFNNI